MHGLLVKVLSLNKHKRNFNDKDTGQSFIIYTFVNI